MVFIPRGSRHGGSPWSRARQATPRQDLQFDLESVDRRHVRRRAAIVIGALFLIAVGLTASVATSAAAPRHAAAPRAACTTSSRAAAHTSTPFDGVCDYLDGRDGVVQALSSTTGPA